MISAQGDTIAAIATPAGAGGIGIIRISGPRAAAIAGLLLDRAPERFPDRTLVFGVAVDRAGQRLDDVLAVVMRAPHSFTGEDVAEIHGHGGVMNMSRLLRATIESGARHADAGEFTRRAFENGKLDLVRAEAILDVIEASSERAWRLAQAQLAGELGTRITRFRERATALLAEVEACIDFPEEGEDYLGVQEVAVRARVLGQELGALAATFSLGKALREGIDIALVGPVNAGKSSIFNVLLGSERALVNAAPGTTRDFVEASAVWDGVTVTLVDTAGDREAHEHVERRGIAMGRKRAAEADLRVQVHSAEHGLPVMDPDADRREIHLVSKGDLLDVRLDRPDAERAGWLITSARTGAGIDALKQAILARALGGITEAGDGHVVTSERQRTLLTRAAQAFEHAAEAMAVQAPIEVLALEVRDGTERLAELMGERVGDEVLDDLFSRFCIGK